jgi:hypothetical protein
MSAYRKEVDAKHKIIPRKAANLSNTYPKHLADAMPSCFSPLPNQSFANPSNLRVILLSWMTGTLAVQVPVT